MRTALRLLRIIFCLTISLQTICFPDNGEFPPGISRLFPPGFVAHWYEPLRYFCKDSELRAGCEYLEKGQRQQAYRILREYLKKHPSDLVAVTAYTQSLTKEEMLKALSELQKRQKHLSPVERYQLGIIALYLFDQLTPIEPGQLAKAYLAEQYLLIAREQLTAAYQSLPEPMVAFYVFEMYDIPMGGWWKAIEVAEDQLRRIGGQTIYQRYLQAKERKWKGVSSLPVPSHLQSSQLWLFSRFVLRLYRKLGTEWVAQKPISQNGVVVGVRLVKGSVDPAGRDYVKNWYDRIQKVLQKNPPPNQN
jgi:tetratricopeptide (TPR) repeat protein